MLKIYLMVIIGSKLIMKKQIVRSLRKLKRIPILLFLLVFMFSFYQCKPDGDGDNGEAIFRFYLDNHTSYDLEVKTYWVDTYYDKTYVNIDTIMSQDTISFIVATIGDTSKISSEKYDLLEGSIDSVFIYKNDSLLRKYLPESAIFNIDNWNVVLTAKSNDGLYNYSCYYTLTNDSLK